MANLILVLVNLIPNLMSIDNYINSPWLKMINVCSSYIFISQARGLSYTRHTPHRTHMSRFPFYQLISNSDWILSECPWESNFLGIQFISDVRMSPQSSSQGWSRQCSEASSISLQWFTISIWDRQTKLTQSTPPYHT